MPRKKDTPLPRTTKEHEHGLPSGADKVPSEPREERLITSPGPVLEQERRDRSHTPETGPGGE